MAFQFNGLYNLISRNKDIIFDSYGNNNNLEDINGCVYQYRDNSIIAITKSGELYSLDKDDEIFKLDFDYNIDSIELTDDINLVMIFIRLYENESTKCKVKLHGMFSYIESRKNEIFGKANYLDRLKYNNIYYKITSGMIIAICDFGLYGLLEDDSLVVLDLNEEPVRNMVIGEDNRIAAVFLDLIRNNWISGDCNI